MDSQPSFLPCAAPVHVNDAEEEKEPAAADVDPFLKEALQNPRHRLTVLRMEMDIQRFMQSPEQQYFEFQHFPTSYLRLAAHRVAQHYGLHSTVLDNSVDGSGSKIIVQKTVQSKYPCICLSEIPAKLPENEKSEQVKITIRPRPQRSSSASELGLKKSPTRTVEERKEEYDRARARIFSSSSSDMEGTASHFDTIQGRSSCSSRKESELYKNMADEMEKSIIKDSGSNSRVAIFRDREKDLSDPDYDRSYDRYVRSLTAHQNVGPGGAFAIFQAPFVPYETNLPHPSQLPRPQTSVNYRPSNHMLSPYCAIASNQPSQDPVYMHWPSPAMMYAQSYEHFRHAVVQPPFYQQPLSFDHLQNH